MYHSPIAQANEIALREALVERIQALELRYLRAKATLSSRDPDVAMATKSLEDAFPSEFAGVKRWFLPFAPVMPRGPGRYAAYLSRLEPAAVVSRAVDHQTFELKTVIFGSIIHDGRTLTAGDWIWAPAGRSYEYTVGEFGALLLTTWPYTDAQGPLSGEGDCRVLPCVSHMPDVASEGRFFAWLSRIDPNTTIPSHGHDLEKLGDLKVVINGSITVDGKELTAGEWLWAPCGESYSFSTGDRGALLLSEWPWN